MGAVEYDDDDNWSYLFLCAEPTLYEGLKFAKDLIIANLFLRLVIQYIQISQNVRHCLSFIIGSLLLLSNIGTSCLWTIGLAVGAYVVIVTLSVITKKRRGLLVSLSLIMFLMSCEMYIVNPKMWQQIRGIQMVAAMKIISVAIDLDRGLFKKILNPIEFIGYVLCPANCILGPWVSYHTYDQYLDVKYITRRWLCILCGHLCQSMFYLILSNCIIPWYIMDEAPDWIVAYRDAQAFRMSHYFVSSMSVVSMISAGFGLTNDCRSDIHITKPQHIELPRSLVQVVVYWNMPMHQWLKNYVFKSCRPHGLFISILITYIMSSLLHGINFQLWAVLLSIGTFSYVEYNLRSAVASALEVCCLVNPCKQCDHRFKKNSLLAVIVNGFFSLIAIVHLAYLGVMFEASFSVQETGYSYLHTLSKWENLNYFSHGLAAFMYVSYLMM